MISHLIEWRMFVSSCFVYFDLCCVLNYLPVDAFLFRAMDVFLNQKFTKIFDYKVSKATPRLTDNLLSLTPIVRLQSTSSIAVD